MQEPISHISSGDKNLSKLGGGTSFGQPLWLCLVRTPFRIRVKAPMPQKFPTDNRYDRHNGETLVFTPSVFPTK